METKIGTHRNSNISIDPFELLLTVHSRYLSGKELIILTSIDNKEPETLLTAKDGMKDEESAVEQSSV